MIIQIVDSAGTVVDCIVVPDGATVEGATATWAGGAVSASAGSEFMAQAGAAIGWTLAGGVLVPPATSSSKADLAGHARAKQRALATGGYTISGNEWPTDTASLAFMAAKMVRLQQPGAPTSAVCRFGDDFTTITSTDFIAAAVAVVDFVEATVVTLESVLSDVEDETITTFAGVDEAAWPSSVAS